MPPRKLDRFLGPAEEKTRGQALQSRHSLLLGVALLQDPANVLLELALLVVRVSADELQECCQVIELVLDRRPRNCPAATGLQLTYRL